MPTVVRVLIQLAATGPMIMLYPFALVLAVVTFFTVATEGIDAAKNMQVVVGGALGLTGLYLSILLPVEWLRSRAWLRWPVVALMLVGFVLTGFFIEANPDLSHLRDGLVMVWGVAGSVVVAVWNTWRIFSKQPMREATA
jgi:hypothetical protein